MAADDWCPRWPTLGGTPMVSWVGRRVVATDHTVAIVRTCGTCLNKFVAHRDPRTGGPDTHCERCR